MYIGMRLFYSVGHCVDTLASCGNKNALFKFNICIKIRYAVVVV